MTIRLHLYCEVGNRDRCLSFFVDLPALTSIVSKGCSLYYQRTVTLESDFLATFFSVDVPNLSNIQLPSSFLFGKPFQGVDSKTISSAHTDLILDS